MRENECLTVFIVDDEAGAREVLARDLRKFPQITQIYCFNNYDECTLPLLQLHPDVLFLDVQVPGCTGLEFLESVRARLTFNFKVVFYTGYADYMLQAIRLSAFDYLLKPFQPSELNTLIERIFNSDDYDIRHHPLVHPTSVRKVAVQTITELLFLTMEQIVMLSYMADQRSWQLLLANGQEYMLRKGSTADDLLALHPSLVRVSSKSIINTTYLSSVENSTQRCRLCPPFDKIDIQMSRRNFSKLRALFEQI